MLYACFDGAAHTAGPVGVYDGTHFFRYQLLFYLGGKCAQHYYYRPGGGLAGGVDYILQQAFMLKG